MDEHICGDETYEDESQCDPCDVCGEYTSPARCTVCHEIIFESSCCG